MSRGGGFGGPVSEGGAGSGSRAVPYLCPFCGEEDLRPTEDGRWHCRSCLRVFSLSFHGLAAPEASTLPFARPDDLEE